MFRFTDNFAIYLLYKYTSKTNSQEVQPFPHRFGFNPSNILATGTPCKTHTEGPEKKLLSNTLYPVFTDESNIINS